MNTGQLESFIQVAENLNFARAAEILNITQSAVSRQIHSLEEELGTKLLHRTTRTVTLTPAGITFLEDAKHVMGRLHLAAARIQNHQTSNIQVLSIGCGNEADLDLVGKVMRLCREQLPEIHPFLRVIPHRSILNLLYQGELDILFGFKDDIPTKEDIIYRELAKIPLCCVLPANHPLTSQDSLSEEALYTEHIICCNSYSIPSRAAEMQNRISQHVLPDATYICENMQVLLTLVRSGYGCSVLPEISFIGSDVKCVPLKNHSPLSYGLFYKAGTMSPLLKHFISIVKKVVPK